MKTTVFTRFLLLLLAFCMMLAVFASCAEEELDEALPEESSETEATEESTENPAYIE